MRLLTWRAGGGQETGEGAYWELEYELKMGTKIREAISYFSNAGHVGLVSAFGGRSCVSVWPVRCSFVYSVFLLMYVDVYAAWPLKILPGPHCLPSASRGWPAGVLQPTSAIFSNLTAMI